MKIYALLIYDKKTQALRLLEKGFSSKPAADKFLESNGFHSENKDNTLFVSKGHFCRIKEVTVCESDGTDFGTPEQVRFN